ncbi:hypothetical protein [Arthrobacter sp. KK5.5]|uniref:hypothetical protein n=1 Tax=Arthrobacter sp. KK5.5 TaxID=3373084 RepID=UPI003EE5D8AA
MRIYYFHGGTPTLNEGEQIVPTSQSGARSTNLESQLELGANQIAQRTDKVYLTTDLELAQVYAGLWTAEGADQAGGGSVYQVEVRDGSMESDQDLLSSAGVSYQADSAVVIAVWNRSVAFKKEKFAKKLKKVLSEHERAKAAKTAKGERAAEIE